MMSRPSPRKLLLTFDAFGTLFTPKEPIAKQYASEAQKLGLGPVSERDLESSFRAAFKQQSLRYPNYGKATGMTAPDWWADPFAFWSAEAGELFLRDWHQQNIFTKSGDDCHRDVLLIIRKTFDPFVSPSRPLPPALVENLLARFSTSAGYRLYPDVLPLFDRIRTSKRQTGSKTTENSSRSRVWPWDLTVVGVITNSDDRVTSILSSLGLDVGPRRLGGPGMEEPDSAEALKHDINFTVLSYDAGVEKPDRKIYDGALKLLGMTIPPPSSHDGFVHLHVGDDIHKDVLGARSAGWNSILIDREGQFIKQFRNGSGLRARFDDSETESDGRTFEAVNDFRSLHTWNPRRPRENT